MELTVTTDESGKRLDLFLVSHLPSVSRSAIQKMIKAGEVTVNEKKVTVHHFLKSGDRIRIENSKHQIPNPKQISILKSQISPLTILYEDDNYIVIDKPSGIAVHSAPGITGPTLVDMILAERPGIRQIGDDPSRPGIVHRLDKDVSGAMVIAKTPQAFEDLKRQFAGREVGKVYTALVVGKLPKDEGEITFAIGRSKRRGRMAARPTGAEGKEAVTRYDVERRFANATLLRVQIETGRTHQIRAHFHALGHPIVGDARYRIKSKALRKETDRPFLHSTELRFRGIDGRERIIHSPLPDELDQYLSKLEPRT